MMKKGGIWKYWNLLTKASTRNIELITVHCCRTTFGLLWLYVLTSCLRFPQFYVLLATMNSSAARQATDQSVRAATETAVLVDLTDGYHHYCAGAGAGLAPVAAVAAGAGPGAASPSL